ncbi:MAG: hypothetical protein AAFU61_01855 [Pseudomonadota bacterium]
MTDRREATRPNGRLLRAFDPERETPETETPETGATPSGDGFAEPRMRAVRPPAIEARLEDVLAWPSGEGDEVASFAAHPEEVFEHVCGRLRAGQKAFLFEEAGARAVVLTGLAETPFSIVREPELSNDRVSVIADAAFPPAQALAVLTPLLADRFAVRPAAPPSI